MAALPSIPMTTFAAISGYYLILLIPAALAVAFVFLLSRQKWERPKGDDAAGPDTSDPADD